MGLTDAYRKLIRYELLKKLSDEDKTALALLQSEDRLNKEMQGKLDAIMNEVKSCKHSFASDLSANVLGNALFDGAVWIGANLLKRIRS